MSKKMQVAIFICMQIIIFAGLMNVTFGAVVPFGSVQEQNINSYDAHKERQKNIQLAVTNNFTITVTTTVSPPSGHNYFFMRSAGSDTNCSGIVNADDPGSGGLPRPCAWATPNHAVSCGDAIVMQPTSWSLGTQSFGATSNCPSTTGGIDGSGGINFAVLMCGGTDLEGCAITLTSDFLDQGSDSQNNWAIEGMKINAGGHIFMVPRGCSANTHHWASINNVVSNSSQAAGMNDCGNSGTGTNTISVDYWAVVGTVAQNSAQATDCRGAIDNVAPGVHDTNSGTHIFAWGNFSFAHTAPTRCAPGGAGNEDVEALFVCDTCEVHAFTPKVVFANNIAYSAARFCMQMFYQNAGGNTTATPISVYNNTCFRNNLNENDNMNGEINLNNGPGTIPWVITLQNNIAYQPLAVSPGGTTLGFVSAFALYGAITSLTNGGTGNENIFFANNSSCRFTFCDTTNSAESNGTNANLGTNIYTNPNFNNTTDLLSNWVGVPTCTGKENVTQCMGYDATTNTLTTNTPIYDLTATCSQCSGKGYQLPSMTCVSSASFPDFPAWLKGIVYLHWNGSVVQQRAGLVKVPCGM